MMMMMVINYLTVVGPVPRSKENSTWPSLRSRANQSPVPEIVVIVMIMIVMFIQLQILTVIFVSIIEEKAIACFRTEHNLNLVVMMMIIMIMMTMMIMRMMIMRIIKTTMKMVMISTMMLVMMWKVMNNNGNRNICDNRTMILTKIRWRHKYNDNKNTMTSKI